MMQKTRILSIRTIVLLIASVLAVTLCLTGTARAALSIFSPDYQAEFATSELGVTLTENGEPVQGKGALLGWMKDKTIIPGEKYGESLAAMNNGTYDEYVRVVVTKYWTKADGTKDNTINPELIQLEVDNGWTTESKTAEQIVLYSTDMLRARDSREFIKSISIDPAIVTDVKAKEKTTIEGNKTTYTYTYTLDGYSFNIEAEVDAVQTHNASDAIKSVWGYTVPEDQLS